MVENKEAIRAENKLIAMMQMYQAGFLDGYMFALKKKPRKKVSLKLAKACADCFQKRFQNVQTKKENL